jgi:ABC-2 type transport system ATP-binding protein
MIEARDLTKDYGDKRAVDALSFDVRPGIVTGFLGPNGSGKSTTMRLILGLDSPTRGQVTVNGRPYRDHPAPLHEVGALLEARSVHTGRSARNHLLALAQTHGIPRKRVDELIDRVWKPDAGGEKWFCGDCGSSLFGRNPSHADPIAIRMGAFDEDPGIRPSVRQFVAYAAPWERIPDDGLPCHPESRHTRP